MDAPLRPPTPRSTRSPSGETGGIDDGEPTLPGYTTKWTEEKEVLIMNKSKSAGADMESLMNMLSSNDSTIRLKARKALAVLGKPAVPSLNRALGNSKVHQIRWEAAITLGIISDPGSIPTLVKALERRDDDVAWLAAVALSKVIQIREAHSHIRELVITSFSNE